MLNRLLNLLRRKPAPVAPALTEPAAAVQRISDTTCLWLPLLLMTNQTVKLVGYPAWLVGAYLAAVHEWIDELTTMVVEVN